MIEQTNTSRPGAILQSKSQPISATSAGSFSSPFRSRLRLARFRCDARIRRRLTSRRRWRSLAFPLVYADPQSVLRIGDRLSGPSRLSRR